MPTRSAPTPARKYAATFGYTDRAGKARYIAAKYAPLLRSSVLDVGCDRKLLKLHLAPGVRYVGVDASPEADVTLNLDRDDLPFAPGSFDTVIAADVLEHLERLHAVFDQLCAVAAKHVIIALPNPIRNLMLELAKGDGGASLKHYGLPPDPPRDRHRWFFGAEEAADFLRARAERNAFRIEQLDIDEQGLPPSLASPLFAHPNITRGTTWCVLARDA